MSTVQTRTVIPLQGIIHPVPALDEEGNHIVHMTKFNGRDVKAKAYENVFLTAGVPVSVSASAAVELVKNGLARWPEPTIDPLGDVAPDPLA